MPKIIVDASVVEDNWQIIAQGSSLSPDELTEGNYLLPLDLWNSLAEQNTPPANLGIWLNSDQLPEQIQGDFLNVEVIAINFPVFADGRGFSIARLLRQRYDYKGQIRAIGNPIRDQLTYMRRCGFNAFDLAEHYDLEQALASLQDFSETYQTAVDQPLPLFRRRG